MGHIQKLPFLAGCSAAIVTGITSYAAGVENQMIYLRMSVMMLVFFILGYYAKNTILSIKSDVQAKEIQRAIEEEHNQRLLKEEQRANAHATKQPYENQGRNQTSIVDLVADDTEDFEPLALSKAIKTKVKE